MLFFKHLFAVCSAAWTINHHIYELSGCVLTAYAQLLIIISASALSFCNILNRAAPQHHNRLVCVVILLKPVDSDCFHWNPNEFMLLLDDGSAANLPQEARWP